MNLSTPSFFAVRGLRPSVLGESYVLIAVSQPAPTLWSAEYHLLISRPEETRRSGVVPFDITGYPAELPPIDRGYMVEEAVLQADRALAMELQARITSLANSELDPPQFRLEPIQLTPVSLWVRGIFKHVLLDVAETSSDSSLRRYLQVVTTASCFRAASRQR